MIQTSQLSYSSQVQQVEQFFCILSLFLKIKYNSISYANTDPIRILYHMLTQTLQIVMFLHCPDRILVTSISHPDMKMNIGIWTLDLSPLRMSYVFCFLGHSEKIYVREYISCCLHSDYRWKNLLWKILILPKTLAKSKMLYLTET